MGFRKRSSSQGVSIPREGLDIVGESHYQDVLRSIARKKLDQDEDYKGPVSFPVVVDLRREPDNPFDPNAVQCLIDGKLVGYINREAAPRLQDVLRQCETKGQTARLDCHIYCGWWRSDDDYVTYGVKID